MSRQVFEEKVNPDKDEISTLLQCSISKLKTVASQRAHGRACSDDIEERTELPCSVKSFRAIQNVNNNVSCLNGARTGKIKKASGFA